MSSDAFGRRDFLQYLGAAGLAGVGGTLPGWGEAGSGAVIHEAAAPQQSEGTNPKYNIKFAVCGMSHDHIYSITEAIRRGGGVLVKVWGGEPDKLASTLR